MLFAFCKPSHGGISWWEHTVYVSYHDALEEGNNENNSAGWVVVE